MQGLSCTWYILKCKAIKPPKYVNVQINLSSVFGNPKVICIAFFCTVMPLSKFHYNDTL